MVIREGERTRDLVVSRLDEIPFGLIKEVVPKYPGRSSHLKRALKLISDPMVQKNLRAPLQWTLLDITKSSLAWNEPKDAGGIPTLSDRQFLFLLDRCKYFITRFKRAAGIDIHDIECRSISADEGSITRHLDRDVIDAFYADRILNGRVVRFEKKYGVPAGDVTDLIRDAHLSALMVMLLFTGMRSSETKFLKRGCLLFEHGYWFLKSKVVKAQPKEMPPVEGWLAVDITMDAYEVLSFVCERTGCNYLFSSPFVGYAKSGRGYSGCSLNTKFSRWIKRNDTEGLFFGWHFSVHQCRETLVSQLAKQEVGLPFISMQMKHFHSRLKSMPNAVTAGYGQYRAQLFASVAGRMAEARETALLDVYGETAKFAGGGAERHKARIDAFFSGLGLFGPRREGYIRDMARRGVRLMPTSIGSCTKNFLQRATNSPAPCYGDYQCDPDCHSHVITDRCARALLVRREHALAKMRNESNDDTRDIWAGLANKLDRHIRKLSEASDA
jgi:integrase